MLLNQLTFLLVEGLFFGDFFLSVLAKTPVDAELARNRSKRALN